MVVHVDGGIEGEQPWWAEIVVADAGDKVEWVDALVGDGDEEDAIQRQ